MTLLYFGPEARRFAPTKERRLPESRQARPRTSKEALQRLAARIRNEHEEAQRLTYDSLTHAREVGRLLLEVKAGMRHGRFMKWVTAECPFSHSTANGYMLVARNWERLEPKIGTFPNFVFSGAVKWLRSQRRADRFNRQCDELVSRIERFLNPGRWILGRLRTLMPRFNREDAEVFRAELVALRPRFDEAVAELDRFISGEIEEQERAERERRLARFISEEGVEALLPELAKPVSNEPGPPQLTNESPPYYRCEEVDAHG